MSAQESYNRGASWERDCLRRYLRRKLRESGGNPHLQDVLLWLNKRTERTAERPGGLGRKRPR